MIGIYKITNRFNGKVYIGQSQDIEKRKEQHFGELKCGKHPNRRMQWDYNHHASFFVFEVLEECADYMLNARESYWVNFYHATDKAKGYNEKRGGGYKRNTKYKSLLDELTS